MYLVFSLFFWSASSVPDIDDEDEIHDVSRATELPVSDDGLDNLSSMSGTLSLADSRFNILEEDALYPYHHHLLFYFLQKIHLLTDSQLFLRSMEILN